MVADPAPAAFLKGFGDNGIDFELGVWIQDPENGQLPVRSAINLKSAAVFSSTISRFLIRNAKSATRAAADAKPSF